uniref:Uncharacterized protein n=1 Tax=Arundo donax TaxID=35708 RepID=A0A0A9GYZ2_ARUDO
MSRPALTWLQVIACVTERTHKEIQQNMH